MTVENTKNKMSPLQMGVTAEFPFNFAVLLQDPTEEEALQAIKAKVALANGEEIELVYGTDYTVELNTDRLGGTLTVKNLRTTGDYITIYRQYEQTQEVDYRDFNSAPAETFEQCFDKLTMLSQQQQEEINRSLKFSISSTSVNPSLPEPVANNTLIWNEEGTDFENYDIIGENNQFKADVNFAVAQGQANIQAQFDAFDAAQTQELEQFKTQQTNTYNTFAATQTKNLDDFKTEQTQAFADYKTEINSDIDTVLEAADKVNELEDSVALAITSAEAANTAAQDAKTAANNATNALAATANKDLSNLSETGENKFVKTSELVEVNYVNKSGDTMTGHLVVENGYVYNKGASTNTIDFTTTTTPSSTISGGNYNFRDKNNQTCGQITNQLDNYGYLRTILLTRRSVNGSIKVASISVGLDKDGNIATYAPTPSQNDSSTKIATTAFCDGVTTVKYKTIVSNLTMTTNQEYTYSLSDYLPNDSNKYEVLFAVYADMNGNNASLQMKTDFQTNYVIVARGSGGFTGASTRQIIGSGRSITIRNTATQGITMGLVAFEYRKVR